MASAGPNAAGTVNAVDNAGGPNWNDPTNVQVDDANAASVSKTGAVATSDFLNLTNFGFNVANNETIENVQAQIRRNANANSALKWVKDSVIQLLYDGNVIGTNKADTVTQWGTGTATISYTDFGGSLTPAIVNDSSFGIQLVVSLTSTPGTEYGYVYYVTLTITSRSGRGRKVRTRRGWASKGSRDISRSGIIR